MFVHVFTDIGKSRPVILKAKVLDKSGNNYTIKYLSPTGERYNGKSLYRYEDETYTIDEESVTECIDETNEEFIGYVKVPMGDMFVEEEGLSDPDYAPSESGASEPYTSDSSDESEEDSGDSQFEDDDYVSEYGDDDDNIFRD
jgi:hypothetical protein